MITIPPLTAQALAGFLASETAERFAGHRTPPYHVNRSKLFVMERLDSIEFLNAARIARTIEYTRVPYNTPSPADDLNEEEGLLLRAADLIGRLGDPNYLKKANALFNEFEEIGLNKVRGYEAPADIVEKYPQFYWSIVAPQVRTAIRYLNVTSSGRQWIAGLYANVSVPSAI